MGTPAEDPHAPIGELTETNGLLGKLTGRNAVTSSSATEVSVASELRHQLVEQIRASNHSRSAALESAFRTVPRHAFTPEAPPEGGLDAIVVTVDTGYLPRTDARAVGARLVAPLRLHGYLTPPTAPPCPLLTPPLR